ncbi:MAG: ABC transporter ATP-binding protein [Halapricum sp.]
MSTPVIETVGLTKRYGNTTAVSDLKITVCSGEIYGFVGENGAGKSTTIGMIMDYIRPTEGNIRVLGSDSRDVVDVHQQVGVLPDQFSLYDGLTGQDHLELVIDTKRSSDDPKELYDRVGLSNAFDQDIDTYSRGMKQRLALAMALVGEPSLLVLDEPFSGLDPLGVRSVRNIIDEAIERGATVFFSSHVLGQVELVCDRIGILHDGQLLAEGTIDELRNGTAVESDSSVEDMYVSYVTEQNQEYNES